jgi:Fic family protein
MNKLKRVGQLFKGSIIGGELYHTYVPQKLPPDPALELSDLLPLLEKAIAAIARLDGMSMALPDASVFLYMYVRKEAVLSSQIEGTQSSLSDLLLFETEAAPGVPLADVSEVSSYVAAMNFGLQRLQDFPLSLRLIKEIHRKLMENSRGANKMPGEFRSSQNWIGGSRPGNAKFVPPSPEMVMQTMGDLENFLNEENSQLPVLIKAALAHVQFETIHPFLDGNGRLGRLLITFILCREGVLKLPLLYLSLYLKENRQLYYQHLQLVRETGDWESWLKFFLTGVVETANQAAETAQAIAQLFNKDRTIIENSRRSTAAILFIHSYLQRNPITNTTKLKKTCALALPTVIRSLNTLADLGIVKEITGKERHKIFVYTEYLEILNLGTEPLKY